MKKIIQFFKKASDLTDKVVTVLVFFLVGSMVLVTTLQVIFRVFFTALTWSEELSRYLLVWSTFFAATMAYKRGNHIAINFIVELFNPKMKGALSVINYILSIIFFGAVIIYGWKMIQMQIFQISPALSIPMQYVYLSIPISLIIMIIHALAAISQEIQKLFKGGEKA